ncbi:MAG: TonB-dependent receptor [Caulobacteraceae bacterium]
MLSGAGVGAMAMAMLAGPAFAQAQTSPPANAGASAGAPTQAIQEIVVTGVRASVASAIQLKKSAAQLQDSIVAEDIGKLPDNNVVEALQHVSGISIIRNSVEPGTVLIRGLPDIATTLNGRQIFTSAGRFISLPDLPAELLAKVDVKKSSTADDLEGGIAGLVNVDLHRPFDFRTPQLAGGIKGTYGTLSTKMSTAASVLASDRWMTGIGEVGLLVDVSFTKRLTSTDTINQITQLVGRRTVPGVTATGPAGTFPGSAPVAVGQIATPSTTTFGEAPTQIERGALNASAQWRPNDRMEFFGEFFYSRLRNEAPNQVNVFLLGVNPNAAASVPFSGTNVGQILPSGGYGLTSTQDRHSIEDTWQFATGGKWQVTDKLKVDGEFDYTDSKSNTTAYIVDAQYNYTATPSVTPNLNGVTLSYNTLGNGGVIAVQPGQQQLNPANTFLDQFYDSRSPVAAGHEYALRFNGSYEIGNSFLRSIDVGYRYDDRSAVSDANAFLGLNCALTSGDGSNVANKYKLAAINSPACAAFRANSGSPFAGGQATNYVGGVSYASLGSNAYSTVQHDFFGGMFGTNRWVSLAPGYIRNNVQQMRALFGYSGPQDFTPTNHFDVDERSHAGFVKANYAFDIANIPIDGNIGVRIIQTTLTEKGFTSKYTPLDPTVGPTLGANASCVTCVTYTPSVATKTDTQVLPSFNLRAKLIDNLYMRGGFSDTVTRPTFTQLNPGLTLNAPTATLLATASGGNPDLVPVKSRNYDLDLSYYWGKANHVSVATFYREVQGYIQNGQGNLNVQGVNYILTKPVNAQNGNIKGIEIGYSQFLDFLPGLWSGLGWDVNATEVVAPFNNVAKYHINASGIYEKGPYSLRFSYTWNSEYLVGAFGTGAQPQFTYAAPRENADVSFNYRWNDHLTFSVDATNLLDGYQRQYAGKGTQNAAIFPTGLQRFDKTYSIGLRYKW